jgi:hypothetical protein
MIGILLALTAQRRGAAGLDPPPDAAPVITNAGDVTGTGYVGDEHSVTGFAATGSPSPSLAYQWRSNGSDITGATSATYTPVATGTITRLTTATNSAGSDSEAATGLAISTTPFPGIGSMEIGLNFEVV